MLDMAFAGLMALRNDPHRWMADFSDHTRCRANADNLAGEAARSAEFLKAMWPL
jgi:hypothetical protein